MTTLRQLIIELQSRPEAELDLPIIIEPSIDCMDTSENGGVYNASDLFNLINLAPIVVYKAQSQSNRESKYDSDEDQSYIEFGFNAFEDSLENPLEDKVDCLVISSQAFKYGPKD